MTHTDLILAPKNEISVTILKMKVHVTSLNIILELVKCWDKDELGRYICVANVHMCMETFDDIKFQELVNLSNLTVPDGRPLVWAQQIYGFKNAEQVRGTDLTLSLCEYAEREQVSVGFYGSSSVVISKLVKNLKSRFPKLTIAFSYSPPYRHIRLKDEKQDVFRINETGVQILFIGLGCPKQEKWMAMHKDDVCCTLVGVGAAFDFIAGSKKQPPEFLQKLGLEWLFRLADDPQRLWKRYFKHNTRFIYYFSKQILRQLVL